jgi:GNAT superfamily N-acetyltransferase
MGRRRDRVHRFAGYERQVSVRYDGAYRETRSLEDGTVVTLRCIRPDDRELLERGFSRLSTESRYRRFLAVMPVMTTAMARYLTEVDGDDHFAVVATKDSLDLKSEEGIGVARFHRLGGEPEVAEAAVTVLDEYQGKGLGRMLLGALAEAARERNVRTFRGSVLAENEPMRRLLDEAGGVARLDEGDTIVVDVPLGHAQYRWSDLPIFRVLRAAAAATRAALEGHA